MSDRSAKLLLDVAEQIEAQIKLLDIKNQLAYSRFDVRGTLPLTILRWAYGYREHIKKKLHIRKIEKHRWKTTKYLTFCQDCGMRKDPGQRPTYVKEYVRPEGGQVISVKEAEEAMRMAMEVIEFMGTTAHDRTDVMRKRQEWMRRYFPGYAE